MTEHQKIQNSQAPQNTEQLTKPKSQKKRKTGIEAKIIFVGLVMIAAWLASTLVFNQVREREILFEDARASVAEQWGSSQTILGPIVQIPYTEVTTVGEQEVEQARYAYLLPQELSISGTVIPEKRTRGIYDSIVYSADLQVMGSFTFDQDMQDRLPPSARLDESRLLVSLNDTRGITEQFVVTWNEEVTFFEPGTGISFLDSSTGVSAPISLGEQRVYEFSFPLNFRGAHQIDVTPLGANTRVDMNSSWTTPGFVGNFLPDERVIDSEGFTAQWNVSSFGRSYPQLWFNHEVGNYELIASAFGVELVNEIDFYSKVNRATKYAIMFIVLTFASFFLFELLSGLKIHPVQYLFVGLSLVLFYLLLLSLSEHIGFLWAYVLAAAGTIGTITLYSRSLLKNIKRVLIIFLLLIFLYLYLYILLQLQTLSLLIGSIFLFVVLGLIMYLTRKIDWYSKS